MLSRCAWYRERLDLAQRNARAALFHHPLNGSCDLDGR
jgi:hypothetical protein